MVGLNYNKESSEILKEKGLELFDVEGFLKQSPRVYKEGIEGETFFDLDCLTEKPKNIESVIRLYFDTYLQIPEKKREKINCLYFIDKEGLVNIGALKLSAFLSYYLNIPNVIVRMEHEVNTSKLKVSNLKNLQNYDKGLLITDHITTGKEILKAINIIESFKNKILTVIAFSAFKRKFKSLKELENKKIDLYVCYYIDDSPKKYDKSNELDKFRNNVKKYNMIIEY